MSLTTEAVVTFAKAQNVQMVDFKVIDLVGRWHHITIPVSQFNQSTFSDGIGIDASSYPGYKKVAAGDVKIIPDSNTYILDPFTECKTLSMICDIFEPDATDPGGDGPVVDQPVQGAVQCPRHGGDAVGVAQIDGQEARVQEEPNLGYKFPPQAGYHGVLPADTTFDLRSRMVKLIEEAGIPVKYHHHEVGSAAQVEIEVPHDTLLRSADATMLMKYIIKNAARQSNKVATFMPKPLYQQAGNGMHVHQYLSDGKVSLFYNQGGYASLSQLALYYIAGLLKHGPALLAFTNPSTNSYKRLLPGFEAPVSLSFGAANRTAAIRIPTYDMSRQRERVEFRPPDSTCNPYLALPAMLMAGLDGIENRIDPTAEGFGPFEINIAEMDKEQRANIKTLPSSLEDSLDALKADHDFLLKGEVFTEDLIDAWIEYKLQKEVNPLQARPHPYEFELYSDI